MSPRGPTWRKGGANVLRLIADRPHAHPRTHLLDCPAGWARVAIFTPAGHLSHVRFGEVIDGVVTVRLFAQRERATRCEPIPEAPGARHRVTMPVWGEEAA